MNHQCRCGNQKCSEYDRPFPVAMSPREFRADTGRVFQCAFCDRPLEYLPGRGLDAVAHSILAAVDRANGGCWDGWIRHGT